MNSVSLVGRFTADPELRYTQSGTAVVGFTLAVQRSYKNGDGEYDADFISCVAWRNTAEFIANYGGKGQRFAVSGELQTRTYDHEQKGTVYVTEVNVTQCTPIDWKEQEEKTPSKTQQGNKGKPQGKPQGGRQGGRK